MRDRWSIAVVTNDIYTQEDALILNRLQALPGRLHPGRRDRRLPAHRHPRGRLAELAAIAEMNRRFPTWT